jgi:uncharacterized iron-regulated membrane protein
MSALQARRSPWWIVHHWAGVKLGLVLTFVLATGTLATVSNEIDWLVRPALRATPREGVMASPATWYDAASRIEGFAVEEVRAPIEPGFAVQVSGIDAGGEERLVYLDPWTGAVQGNGSPNTVQSVVRDLHRALMLPTRIGVTLVSLLSIPLLLTLATAFKVYKKWWRGFRRWPRPMRDRRGEGRRWAGDLHRLAGVWSLWFVALIGATGLWYLAEKLGAAMPELKPPTAVRTQAMPAPARVVGMVHHATASWPSFHIRGIVIGNGVVALEGQDGVALVRDRATVMWFDAVSGTPLGSARAGSLGIQGRVSEAADPLHFGTWGGLPTKLSWFAFGLALVALSVSGLFVCGLRLASGNNAAIGLIRSMSVGGAAGLVLVAYALLALTRP